MYRGKEVNPIRECIFVTERRITAEKQSVVKSKSAVAQSYKPSITIGLGTILHRLMKTHLGENEAFGCGCKEWIGLMNQWGPQGCREHFSEIVAKLQSAAEARKWNLQKWWAKWATVLAGLPIIN